MELTNKTLAMFLVAAIVVSLAGTIISLNKLGSLATTGYATSDTGTARVEVNGSTSILFIEKLVDFGSGAVNTTDEPMNCTLITGAAKSAGCIDFLDVHHGLELENTGNVNVSVNLNSTNASVFLGGGEGFNGGPQFMFNVSNNESGACVTPLTAWTDFSNVGSEICDEMDFRPTADSLNISIKINIPYTVPPGVKTAVILATATTVTH